MKQSFRRNGRVSKPGSIDHMLDITKGPPEFLHREFQVRSVSMCFSPATFNWQRWISGQWFCLARMKIHEAKRVKDLGKEKS